MGNIIPTCQNLFSQLVANPPGCDQKLELRSFYKYSTLCYGVCTLYEQEKNMSAL